MIISAIKRTSGFHVPILSEGWKGIPIFRYKKVGGGRNDQNVESRRSTHLPAFMFDLS